MSEHALQKAIVQYLNLVLPADQRIVAVANNPRSRVSGAFEKARGMRVGVPDLFLTGRVHGLIEVKTDSGKLSLPQQEWMYWCQSSHVNYALVRSIDDVREALIRWGVTTRDVNSYGDETKKPQRSSRM